MNNPAFFDQVQKAIKSQRPLTITHRVLNDINPNQHPTMQRLYSVIRTQVAPANAELNFSDFIRPQTKKDNERELRDIQIKQGVDLSKVKTWDWIKQYPEDTELQKILKKFITPVGNQHQCGSCWAFSTSQHLSDRILISGFVDYNPQISATFLMACYPQGNCDGGNFAQLLKGITENNLPLASHACLDYSWCEKNNNCLNNSGGVALNNYIPSCGCYNKDGDNYENFYVKDVKLYAVPASGDIALDKSHVDTQAELIKNTLYTEGPIGTGYICLANFMEGDLTYSKSGGLYFENVNYRDDKSYFIDDSNPTVISRPDGGHAVSIVGWGVQDNVKYYDHIQKKVVVGSVPYWLVRNSWGPTAGVGGYFKMPRYPYNVTSQFDVSQDGSLGGMVVARISDKPQLKKMDKNNYSGQFMEPSDFYDEATNFSKQQKAFKQFLSDNGVDDPSNGDNSLPGGDDSDSNSTNISPWLYGTGIFFIILILVFSYFMLRHN